MSEKPKTVKYSTEVDTSVEVEVEFTREELLELLAQLDGVSSVSGDKTPEQLAERVYYEVYGKPISDSLRGLLQAITGRALP